MNFEKLSVWQRATSLSILIYKSFQNSTDFGFKDQITRSSLSIASNIAEGMERQSAKEKCQYLWIAKGSCGELRTQIYIAISFMVKVWHIYRVSYLNTYFSCIFNLSKSDSRMVR